MRLLSLILIITFCLTTSCRRANSASQGGPSSSGSTEGVASSKGGNTSSGDNYQQSKDAALADAERLYEERLNNPPAHEIRLPNFEAGPGRPLPIRVNFYEIHEDYPAYLLCTYDVNEINYDPANEPTWFQAALQQIRNLGPDKFPPFRWAAVIIVNRGEWKDASTYEQGHKVGAIFNIKDVFDSSPTLLHVVVNAEYDRHPFAYDPQQRIPWQQDRWLIVDRHAATTRASAGQ